MHPQHAPHDIILTPCSKFKSTMACISCTTTWTSNNRHSIDLDPTLGKKTLQGFIFMTTNPHFDGNFDGIKVWGDPESINIEVGQLPMYP